MSSKTGNQEPVSYRPTLENPPRINRALVFTFNPDPNFKTNNKFKRAASSTQKFRDNILETGLFNLDAQETETLKLNLSKKIADPAIEHLQGTEITSALHFLRNGGKSQQILDIAKNVAFFSQNERFYFTNVSIVMAAYEESHTIAYPSSADLSLANKNPSISVTEDSYVPSPSANQISFNSNGFNINPAIKEVFGRATKPIRDKVSGAIIDPIKKKITGAVTKAVEKQALKAAAKLGIKTTAKVAIEAAAQSLNAIPGLGLIVAALVEVADKLLSLLKRGINWLKSKIHENKELIAGMGLALLGLGVVAGSPLLMLAGAGMMLGIVGVGGVPLLTAGVSGAVSATLTIVLLLIPAASVGAAALFIFVGFVLVMSVIFFVIINSGYVVPYYQREGSPGPGAGGVVSNPYISVVKTADPAKTGNPFPTKTITYTITISALQGTLSNISFSSQCTVEKRSGGAPSCPPGKTITINGKPASPDTFPPAPPSDIINNSPYTFTYTVTYDSKFNDSLVTDTFTVTATPAGQSSMSTSASASVCFGNCPENCPSGWPVGPEHGETQLQVTQGPYSPYSHTILDGIDITSMDGPDYSGMNGHLIKATHSGTMCVPPGEVDRYGNVVYVVGTCNGKRFASVYAHIQTGSATHPSGYKVTKGQGLALTDDTGGWNFPHLHYEFAEVGAASGGNECTGFYAQPKGGTPNMQSNVPVPVPSCFWNCGIFIK